MSFGVADLIAVAVIKARLQFLSERPEHIEYILSSFCRHPELEALVGREYIAKAVEMIMNNRILVAPHYELDLKHRPSISVIASGNEEGQYIGDEGFSSPTEMVEPNIYAEFDASSIQEDRLVILVAKDYGLTEKIWPGLWVKSDSGSVNKIRGVISGTSHDTICLETALLEDVSLKGWKVQSAESTKGYLINESQDKVHIQCKLQSTGDYSVHRLLGITMRYCLKSSRLHFDRLGLQVATFAYTPPMPTEQSELEFETVFTIEGLLKEGWIAKEYKTPTEIQAETIAVPQEEAVIRRGDKDVYLG